MIACARANGVIVFARKCPRDALPITSFPAPALRKAVSALARHAYDGKTLLVPGLPEAADWQQRVAAITRFKASVEEHLGCPALARRIRRHEEAARGA